MSGKTVSKASSKKISKFLLPGYKTPTMGKRTTRKFPGGGTIKGKRNKSRRKNIKNRRKTYKLKKII